MKTTEEKIEVMQAFGAGSRIGIMSLSKTPRWWQHCPDPGWDWIDFDYCIRPETPEIDLMGRVVKIVSTGTRSMITTQVNGKWSFDGNLLTTKDIMEDVSFELEPEK